ncbi:MAG: hypothetical protein PF795_00840, partial [Kiritimatiellae bacterium]|nr:hypothetical protein [Kiritimatiellia bacterium]
YTMRARLPTNGLREALPALIALGLVFFPASRFGFDLNRYSALAIFTAAFAVYFTDHRLESPTPIPIRCIIGLLTCGFLYVLSMSYQLSLQGVAVYILMSMLYVFPVFPGKERLQDFPRIRVLAIGMGWTALPLLHHEFQINWTCGFYLLGVAGCLIPNILWSDLADAEADRLSGRTTWAMKLSASSIQWVVRISLFLSLLCFALSRTYLMLPLPLAYLLLESTFRDPRQADKADWILLWPLLAVLLS